MRQPPSPSVRRTGTAIWLMAGLAACGVAGQRCLCWGLDAGPCGDDEADLGELCDGVDLRGRTCQDRGYDGGELRCTSTCTYDEGGCWDGQCGDGIRQFGESCDGYDGVVDTCWSLGYSGGGTLYCNDTCDDYDTSGCDQGPHCGDGHRDPDEVCDGDDLGGQTCEGFGYLHGTPSCIDCGWVDASGCSDVPVCGNGLAELDEPCDGSDLRGADCASAGFTEGGALACAAGCRIDARGCRGGCGNDRMEGTEICDDTDLGGLTCADFGYPVGALVCQRDCRGILLGACGTWDATCGNGVKEAGEQCDLAAGSTCQSLGFSGGSLACDATCRIDPRGCDGDPCAAYGQYGDGWCDACEATGGGPDPDCTALCPLADGSCSSYLDPLIGVSTCRYATGAEDPDCGDCGDGVLDAGVELCDGDDFAVDCGDYGYAPTRPAGCDASCVPDLSLCAPHRCGDGILCPGCGEQCDDGNLEPGDGCDADCNRESVIEVEPNDDRISAQDLGTVSWSPAYVAGAITPAGDVDHFRVQLGPTASIQVTVTGTVPASCHDGTANPEVRISGPNSIIIVGSNDDRDPGVDTCSEAEAHNLDPGDYVIRVAASPFADPTLTFSYLMVVSN